MHCCTKMTFYLTPGTDNGEFSMYVVLLLNIIYIYTLIHEGNA